MKRNGVWFPLIGYGILTAAGIGGTLWGVRAVQDRQASTEERIAQLREQQRAEQLEQQARTNLLVAQLKPLMIAGTIAMAGLGVFIVVRDRRDQRRKSRRELIGAY